MEKTSTAKVGIIGNTAWGYCFTTEWFDTKTAALRYARQMKRDGYFFDYRVVTK